MRRPSRDLLPIHGRGVVVGRGVVGLLAALLVVGGPVLATRSDVGTGAARQQTASLTSPAIDDPAVTATIQSIKDKQQNTIGETCAALDEVIESGLVEPGSMGHQQAQCEVGKRNADAITDADVQAVALKRGASGTAFAEYSGPNRDQPPAGGEAMLPSWEPGGATLEDAAYLGSAYTYDGDGDGVCNARGAAHVPYVAAGPAGHGQKLHGFSEWCAEVIGDNVGDDDGFCERHNPQGSERAFEERCVNVELTFDAMTADETNLDVDRLADYDSLLGEAEATAQQFHAATTRAIDVLSAPVVTVSTGTAKGCPANQDRLKEQGIALGIMTGLAVGLEGAADTISAFTHQTVVAMGFGGNSSATLAPLNGAAAAAQIVASALNVTADADTAVNVTNTLECLDQFRAESDQAMTELSDDVAALSSITLDVVELKEKAAYLITATLSGRPLSGVQITGISASVRGPLVFEALAPAAFRFEEIPGAPGTYKVNLTLPSSLSSAGLFVFDVRYEGPDGPVYGHTLFDRLTEVP